MNSSGRVASSTGLEGDGIGNRGKGVVFLVEELA
jgi:hypothetical protein